MKPSCSRVERESDTVRREIGKLKRGGPWDVIRTVAGSGNESPLGGSLPTTAPRGSSLFAVAAGPN